MAQNKKESANIVVAAMYKFVRLPDFRKLREKLLQVCETQSLKGTLLLAEEGINGTVAGSRKGINALLSFLREDPRFLDTYSESSLRPRRWSARSSEMKLLGWRAAL